MSMYHRIREHARLEATSENCLVQPPPSKQGQLEQIAQDASV